jgi:hypothetical protein
MESCRAAEHALVAALVLGQADPADLSGRIRASDFTDPAAGLLFDVAMDASPEGSATLGQDLPRLLRARGALRGDGYPLRELLDWLPALPVPAHPGPWAALVVAGSVGRVVGQCGMRLMQTSQTAMDSEAYGVGRVLALAVAQRAAVHASARRWTDLPARWREALPQPQSPPRGEGPVADRVGPRTGSDQAGAWSAAPGVERDLLSAVVAAPVLVERLSWLRAEDFTDPACGRLYETVSALHQAGKPVDVVTLTAAPDTAPDVAPRPEVEGAAEDLVGWAGTAGAAGEELWGGIDPRLGHPAQAGFLARQVMTVSVLRDAHDAGTRLCEAAAAPAAAGGAGLPLLGQALDRLELLALHGRRWQQACVRPSGSGSHAGRPALQIDRPSLALVRPSSVMALPEPNSGISGTSRTLRTSRGTGSDRTAG